LFPPQSCFSYSDVAALWFVPLPGDLSSELEHLAPVQAALEAIGAVAFGPDEDVSGQPTIQLPDLPRRPLPGQDMLAALEPDAERADRGRFHAGVGRDELLGEPQLVALKLREEHGFAAVVEDGCDQSGPCVETPWPRCIQDQWHTGALLGVEQRQRRTEPR